MKNTNTYTVRSVGALQEENPKTLEYRFSTEWVLVTLESDEVPNYTTSFILPAKEQPDVGDRFEIKLTPTTVVQKSSS